jgi:hypothetical protein
VPLLDVFFVTSERVSAEFVVWSFSCWSHSLRRSKAAFKDGEEPRVCISGEIILDTVKFAR